MPFSVSTRYVYQKRFDKGWKRLSDDRISPELKLYMKRLLRGCCCACFGGCKHFLYFSVKTTTFCVICHCIAHHLLKWWALLGQPNTCINIAHHLYNSKFWWRVSLHQYFLLEICILIYIFSYDISKLFSYLGMYYWWEEIEIQCSLTLKQCIGAWKYLILKLVECSS